MLANVKKAVEELGIKADVSKKWTLSEEVHNRYDLLLSPALAIAGLVVFPGKVFKQNV